MFNYAMPAKPDILKFANCYSTKCGVSYWEIIWIHNKVNLHVQDGIKKFCDSFCLQVILSACMFPSEP